MENPIMKEFLLGFAQLMTAFFKTAARQGFSILLLLITNCGFVIWVDNLNTDIRQSNLEHRAEIAELRNEYRGDMARMQLNIDSLRRGLDDCTTEKIRAQAREATLMALLKLKSKR